jgi:hypothetical protein
MRDRSPVFIWITSCLLRLGPFLGRLGLFLSFLLFRFHSFGLCLGLLGLSPFLSGLFCFLSFFFKSLPMSFPSGLVSYSCVFCCIQIRRIEEVPTVSAFETDRAD